LGNDSLTIAYYALYVPSPINLYRSDNKAVNSVHIAQDKA